MKLLTSTISSSSPTMSVCYQVRGSHTCTFLKITVYTQGPMLVLSIGRYFRSSQELISNGIKSLFWGASVTAQQVKLQSAMPTSRMGASSNSGRSTSNPASCLCAWESSGRRPQYLGPYTPTGDLEETSGS